MTDQIIVTCALPYANGDIHLGHMVEHIQGDIWVRFKKLTGTRCYFIGADDTHGTPVMLKAESLNLTPEEMITQVHKEHVADLKFFDIAYDEFYTTHSPENQEIVYEVFHKLQQNNKICTKTIDQLFDTTKNMFLPDRFVKGTCPKCNALEQYGDNCEVCGATYSPIELKEPYSTISQSKPTVKSSMHFFFKLSECSDFLSKWLNADGHLQLETRNKMQEWLLSGLTDWDISRDKPYFGFAIPDYPDKYFYVWLDAPIGYMSSFMHFCKKNNLDFVNLWNSSKLYHFIGKDILYFHALFWPSVLNYSGYKTPDGLFVHGFLTVNGKKMSKSRGTFITAKQYINSSLDPNFYRFYIASKSSNKIEDIDFSLDNFMLKVNSELIGKFINIASRSAGFLNKFYNNILVAKIDNLDLINKIIRDKDNIYTLYNNREFSKVVKYIIDLVDEINIYVDNNKPWVLAKDEQQRTNLHQICSVLINAFRLISIYLKPIVPSLVTKIECFLNVDNLNWNHLDNLLLDHKINNYTHLITRIEEKQLTNLIIKSE